ncbi:hypothetical protein JOF41_003732 [Saccharothrix coeruleofusca]|uniref:hypothetical protein n=1 Tax=Saccharothrix coeruleofusca TaxID=33919 RepID=UPI001AE62B6E|nr:hypothetical protein [Saccharothrix coeruleofusca]MBP2337554.1 hypothetical protein [Saccharothrix coeruleofusca]
MHHWDAWTIIRQRRAEAERAADDHRLLRRSREAADAERDRPDGTAGHSPPRSAHHRER